MSTVFEVPCPECGRQMRMAADGGQVECRSCGQAYHSRMGRLFPLGSPLPPQPGAPPHSPAVTQGA